MDQHLLKKRKREGEVPYEECEFNHNEGGDEMVERGKGVGKKSLMTEKVMVKNHQNFNKCSSSQSWVQDNSNNNINMVKRKRRKKKLEKVVEKIDEEEKCENENNCLKEQIVCGICFDPIEEQGKLDSCKHAFCMQCIQKWLNRSCRCPHCKQVVKTLVSSTTNTIQQIEKRELKETLEHEESDSDGEDIHDYLDNISLFARSLGMRLTYVTQTHFNQPVQPFASSSSSSMVFLQNQNSQPLLNTNTPLNPAQGYILQNVSNYSTALRRFPFLLSSSPSALQQPISPSNPSNNNTQDDDDSSCGDSPENPIVLT